MTDAERVSAHVQPPQTDELRHNLLGGVGRRVHGDDPGVDEALEPLDLRRVRIIHAQQVGPRLRLPDVLRSMLADETIVPDPRYKGYEPQPDPLTQAVLDAAEAYVDAHWPNGQQAMATHSRALANAVRAWREAQP